MDSLDATATPSNTCRINLRQFAKTSKLYANVLGAKGQYPVELLLLIPFDGFHTAYVLSLILDICFV